MQQPAKRNRWRRLLIALAVLAVLVGWWWFSRPREMRLVEVRQLNLPGPSGTEYSFISSAHYLLASSSIPSLVMIRWDGTVYWKISPLYPVSASCFRGDSDTYNWSISPNGRYCAAVIAQRDIQEIMFWDEGRLIYTITLPLRTQPKGRYSRKLTAALAQLVILDNGQAFSLIKTKPVGSITLIDKGQIQARGKLLVPAGVSYKVSPDGRALIASVTSGFTYHRIERIGNILRLVPVYTAKETPIPMLWGISVPNRPYITSDGFLVAESGAVYDERGRISNQTGWRMALGMELIPTHQSAVLQGRYTNSDVVQIYNPASRILDPRTGETWTLVNQQPHLLSRSTSDGQYLLIDKQPARFTKSTRDWLRQVNLLPDSLIRRNNIVYLSIYRKPGRFCARMPVVDINGSVSIQNPKTGQWFGLYDLSLSEDGHTVYCLVQNDVESLETPHSIFIYQWR